MDQQAQHTPRKDGTDSKEAEEKGTGKETEGQGVGTEVNHEESRNVLGETTPTFTGGAEKPGFYSHPRSLEIRFP